MLFPKRPLAVHDKAVVFATNERLLAVLHAVLVGGRVNVAAKEYGLLPVFGIAVERGRNLNAAFKIALITTAVDRNAVFHQDEIVARGTAHGANAVQRD